MSFFRSIKSGFLIISAAFITIGYFLIVKGQESILIALDILSYILMLVGVYDIVRYYTLKIDERYRRNDFVLGIAVLVAGIALLLFKKNVSDVAELVLGVLIIISAFFRIQDSIDSKKLSHNHFGIYITLVIVNIAFGALIILNPFTDNILYFVIGAGLIFTGASGFISNIYLAGLKAIKERKERKIEEENKKEEEIKAKALEEEKLKQKEAEIKRKIEKEKEDEINNSHMTRIDL